MTEGEAGQGGGRAASVPSWVCHLLWAIRREPGKDAQGSSVNYTLGRKLGQWHFLWIELVYGEKPGHDGKHRMAYSKEQTLKAWQGKGWRDIITVCKSEPQDSRLAVPGLTLRSCSPEHGANYLFQLNRSHRIPSPVTPTSSRQRPSLGLAFMSPISRKAPSPAPCS